MSAPEIEPTPLQTPAIKRPKLLQYSLLIVAASYVVVSLYFIFDTRSSVASLEAAQKVAIANLQQRQAVTEAELKTSNQALAQRLGTTERGLQAAYAGKAAQLRENQRAFEKHMQDQQNAAVDQVTSEMATVRTELSGAKKDIAATRTDLESTKVRLDHAIGDLTGQSGLIARTREDLEELRHRGDRNYYEFSLSKGEHPTQLSTIALQLKKADAKKGKFTLNVIADDRVIEKKDRGVAEPLQFYTGRNRQLFEVVIFTVDKNKVTGYLSTPKTPGLTASRRRSYDDSLSQSGTYHTHDKSPVGFPRQLINPRKNESRLKKFVSIPRSNPGKEVLVESLRDLHGEIARLQSDFDAKS